MFRSVFVCWTVLMFSNFAFSGETVTVNGVLQYAKIVQTDPGQIDLISPEGKPEPITIELVDSPEMGQPAGEWMTEVRDSGVVMQAYLYVTRHSEGLTFAVRVISMVDGDSSTQLVTSGFVKASSVETLNEVGFQGEWTESKDPKIRISPVFVLTGTAKET